MLHAATNELQSMVEPRTARIVCLWSFVYRNQLLSSQRNVLAFSRSSQSDKQRKIQWQSLRSIFRAFHLCWFFVSSLFSRRALIHLSPIFDKFECEFFLYSVHSDRSSAELSWIWKWKRNFFVVFYSLSCWWTRNIIAVYVPTIKTSRDF